MKYILIIISVGLFGFIVYTQLLGTPSKTGMETASTSREDTLSDVNYNNTRSNRSTSEAPDTDSNDSQSHNETSALEVESNDSDEETESAEASLEAELEASVTADEATVREFTLDSFNYGYSMDTITVNEGDTVTITLTNSEGFHDLVIDEFGVATEKIRAGDTTSVTFVADRAGTYEYYCSVGNHRAQGMVGTLVVE